MSLAPINDSSSKEEEEDMKPYNNYKLVVINRKYKSNDLVPPRDLKETFCKFAGGGGSRMSVDQFRCFLVEHQGHVDITLSESEQIVNKILKARNGSNDEAHWSAGDDHRTKQQRELTLDVVFHFLLLNDFNDPLKSEVHHDMEAPLSHYFIYTGHNSYLTGNQFSSECSEEPVIQALQQGVRVIELDLWPTSNKDDIKVVHGRTLTTPVSPRKCLEAIKKYAFFKSEYPVIITIEDHLTRDLRTKFAEMATEILGDLLYYPQAERLTEFPSPKSLKNKIIISTKPPKEHLNKSIDVDRGSNNDVQDGSESSEEETSSGQESPDAMAKPETEDKMADPETEKKEEGDSNAGDQNGFNQQCSADYKRLIGIPAKNIKGSIKDKLRIEEEVRRLSWSELKLEEASESHGTDIIRFTQRNILRVYPKGTRVQSSNFKPHIGWMYGVQMVAFNMQKHGKELWLMQGMFRANGGCGYVKKPEMVMQNRPNGELFDPERTLPEGKTILKVNVYMGHGWSSEFSPTHFDRFSPPDFYTKVSIDGVPADCAEKQTSVIKDNWLPVWEEEFRFPLTMPELALLQIIVREKDQGGKDDFGGQTCLPVSELRVGFRSVPLYDKKGEKYKSVKLFMQFQFIDPKNAGSVE
ncbi:hypothetical protein QN277_015765 [Acacia crassicarpa]|uniref:Phosphoinositide phospholipase C n=1 Tax=Acacia crassicarpa TaxID=499986 RepID=A0AAE1JZ60_9FABA|nr:hypothetical protein QN277_015765 [Acacia crassicarpa]